MSDLVTAEYVNRLIGEVKRLTAEVTRYSVALKKIVAMSEDGDFSRCSFGRGRKSGVEDCMYVAHEALFPEEWKRDSGSPKPCVHCRELYTAIEGVTCPKCERVLPMSTADGRE